MKHLLLSGFICLGTLMNIHAQTIDDIKAKTSQLLATFSEEQLSAAQLVFEDTSRTRWTNLPVGLAPRSGIRFGELSEVSRIALHELLTTILSSQGYLKTTSIMMLDDILNQIFAEANERGIVPDEALEQISRLQWDFENYYLTFWNTPNTEIPWGFKLEGHHLSLNLTAVLNDFTLNPLFVGSDPHVVPITKYAGLKVLSNEEEYAFELLNLLTEDQKDVAILSEEVPGDIITNPEGPNRIDEYYGINASEFNEQQKAALMRLIMEYVNNLEHEISHEFSVKIQSSGLDEVYFAWIGSQEPKDRHYYLINAPDFMIEYDNAGGFPHNGNHIHAIWRDKANDFGEDILRKHYSEHDH